jgi:hypothetical protein
MYQFWSGDGPHTPAQLSTKAVSSRVQWFLAFHHGIQSYVDLHDPFVYPAPPCLNHPRSNQTIWVVNGIGMTGTTLSLVDQPGNLFYLVTTPVLPTDAGFTTRMSTAALGASEAAPIADPAAAGWLPSASTPRCCHPLPHKFVVRTLTLVQGGREDHKIMWEGLASDILAEPAKTTANCSLLDFLKTTALRRPPVAGQAADRPAETQLSFLATLVADTIRHQAHQIRTSRLPGLVPVTGVG